MKKTTTTAIAWMALCLAAAGAGGAERSPAAAGHPAAQDGQVARVIVQYRGTAQVLREAGGAVSARQAMGLAKRTGLSLKSGRSVSERSQIVFAAGLSSEALARRLSSDPDVEWAAPDLRRHVAAVPNDPLYPAGQTAPFPLNGQWFLRAPDPSLICTTTAGVQACPTTSAIDAAGAWQTTTGSSAVVVAVVDTGIRAEHSDLANQVLPGYDFISDVPTANDGNGRDADPSDPGDWITTAEDASGTFKGCGATDSTWHGTQVAGLIGAETDNGTGAASVARGIRILPVRALGKCGGFDSDIIDAMRWAAGLAVAGVPANAHPAQVINLSLGAAGACTAAYQNAVAEIRARNVTIVVAAGNEGVAVDSPANCPGVVAVAGVRQAGDKVGYSSLGPEVSIAAPAGNCVNTGASDPCLFPLVTTLNSGTQGPVSSIYSDGQNLPSLGTSFATPLVSGVAALMRSVNPDLTDTQVRAQLKATARPFPTSGGSSGISACAAPSATVQDECYCTTTTCGSGLLDANAAVLAVRNGQALVTTNATLAPAGNAIVLDASGSVPAAGTTVAAYQWSVASGAAAISGASDGVIARVIASAAGSYTVRLDITDSAGHHTTRDTVLGASAAPAAGGSGSGAGGSTGGGTGGGSTGGGGLGIEALLALAGAWWALRGASRSMR